MSTLFKQLEILIQDTIQDYTQKIAETHDIDQEELLQLWKDVSGSVVKKKTVTKKPPSDTEEVGNDEGCPYKITKGAREGEICGAKPKNGGTYCSRHVKYEGIGQKPKKTTTTVGTKVIAGRKIVSPKKTQPKSLPFSKTKIDGQERFWNKDTGFVLKSKTEQVVVCKIVDGNIVPLDDNDIPICESHSIPYENLDTNQCNETNKECINDQIPNDEVEDKPVISKKSQVKPTVLNKKLKVSTKKAISPVVHDDEDENDSDDDANLSTQQLKKLQKVTKSVHKTLDSDMSIEEVMNEIQDDDLEENQFDVDDDDDDDDYVDDDYVDDDDDVDNY